MLTAVYATAKGNVLSNGFAAYAGSKSQIRGRNGRLNRFHPPQNGSAPPHAQLAHLE